MIEAALLSRPPGIFLFEKPRNSMAGLRGLFKRFYGRSAEGGWLFPLDLDTWMGLQMECMSRGVELSWRSDADRERFTTWTDWLRLVDAVKSGDKNAERMLGAMAGYAWMEKPFPHQLLGTTFLIFEERALLADDMGLGKTKQAIDAACNVPEKTSSILILCPKSVMRNWEREIAANALTDKRNEIIVLDGSAKARAEKLKSAFPLMQDRRYWVISNYEKCRAKKKGREPAISVTSEAADIAAWVTLRQSIVICDEAHRLKSGLAQQSIWVREAIKPGRLWFLSGTPIANRLEDSWHITRMMRPGLLGWYFFEFDRDHIRRNSYGGVKDFMNVPRIRSAIASYSFGRKKEHVIDLPAILEVDRYVELSREEKRCYETMRKDLIAWAEDNGEIAHVVASKDGKPNFAIRFLRLRQILSGYVSASAEADPVWLPHPAKHRELVEVWEDAGRPRAVIWCQFLANIDRLMTMFASLPVPVWAIDGRTPGATRQDFIDAWSMSNSGVLVCQMDTAGEGVNLQAGAWQCFVDQPLTPKQKAQCMGRLHRIGQTMPVTTVHLLAEGTIDEKIRRALDKKIAQAGSALEGAIQTRELIEMLS